MKEALFRTDKSKWLQAMEKEYSSLSECRTWELVERPQNQRVISYKWVLRIKRTQDGNIEKYKARLVARGCEQQYGIDCHEIYAPVARIETIRTLLALSTEEELHVHHLDVITAYVQGKLMSEIYIEQPPMFNICLRPIYGLKQSGRE